MLELLLSLWHYVIYVFQSTFSRVGTSDAYVHMCVNVGVRGLNIFWRWGFYLVRCNFIFLLNFFYHIRDKQSPMQRFLGDMFSSIRPAGSKRPCMFFLNSTECIATTIHAILAWESDRRPGSDVLHISSWVRARRRRERTCVLCSPFSHPPVPAILVPGLQIGKWSLEYISGNASLGGAGIRVFSKQLGG